MRPAIFPPRRNKQRRREAIAELNQRPNPERRLRAYPRVVKRKHVGTKILKKPHHKQIKYTEVPLFEISLPAA